MNDKDKKYTKYIIIGTVVLLIVFIIKKIRAKNMIQDIINQLPRRGEYRGRPLSSIDKIVIHHSASPMGQFTLEDFAKWHIDPNGRLKAPAIAYHFGIEPDGKIYQCNKLTARSWHAKGANTNGIGIVLNGNFEEENPTQAQEKSLKYLIKYLNKKLNQKLAVLGHKELQGNATACPGKNLKLEQFRNPV